MRIAFVIDNLGSGGAQRQSVEVAVCLHREHGADIRFAIYRDLDFFRPRLEEAGIAVTRIPKRGAVDPRFPFRLGAWIRDQAPDVVHAFLPFPVIWTGLSRLRLRGSRPPWLAAERSRPLELTGWLGHAIRRAYAAADAVTVNSVRAGEEIVHAWGLPGPRVHYLPNGIDLAAWDALAVRPAPWELEPDRFQLALVGRLSEEKGHLPFLEALSRIPPHLRRSVRAWFVGADGPVAAEARAVEAEVVRRGLEGQVRRLQPTSELPALLARMDGLVLPSRFEGSPNVVLEAMASRLPVVATDVGDVPSLVAPGQTGWLVPPGSPDHLADALTQLLSLPAAARQAMGAAARARVEERFRIEVVAKMHLDLYRRLAEEQAGDAPPDSLG